jgi:hypothetical protein
MYINKGKVILVLKCHTIKTQRNGGEVSCFNCFYCRKRVSGTHIVPEQSRHDAENKNAANTKISSKYLEAVKFA